MDPDLHYGSQSYYELSCILCDEAGRHVSASVYCTVCQMYLCERCKTLHHRFPPNRSHRLVDSSQCQVSQASTDVNFGHAAQGSSQSFHQSSDTSSSLTTLPTSITSLAFQPRQNHEQRALEIESLREKAGAREDRLLEDLLLLPLNIPTETEEFRRELQHYTVGEVKLCLRGVSGLFKYGSGVYDMGKFREIVQERYIEFERFGPGVIHSSLVKFATGNNFRKDIYVIYDARTRGVSREELKKVLAACKVGTITDLSRIDYFRRMRNEVHTILEEEQHECEMNVYYRKQWFRWLANLSQNLRMYEQNYHQDPNALPFPLPEDVRNDVNILRDWGENGDDDREPWDNEIIDLSLQYKNDSDESDIDPDDDDSDNDDDSIDGSSTDKTAGKDPFAGLSPHEIFVKVCASHVDPDASNLDMDIDGDVAWNEMKCDVILNDETTDEQESILRQRDARKSPLTQKQMQQRRLHLKESFNRYHFGSGQNSLIDVENFISNLETSWEDFQQLC